MKFCFFSSRQLPCRIRDVKYQSLFPQKFLLGSLGLEKGKPNVLSRLQGTQGPRANWNGAQEKESGLAQWGESGKQVSGQPGLRGGLVAGRGPRALAASGPLRAGSGPLSCSHPH